MQCLFKLVASRIPQPVPNVKRNRRTRWLRSSHNATHDDDEISIEEPTITLTSSTVNAGHASETEIDRDRRQQEARQRQDAAARGVLFCLAKSWAWPALEDRCRTHPREACGKTNVDANGDTALHWAVFGNPPVSVIEALLRACPEAASIKNAAGDLPLHLACSYRAKADVLRVLLRADPSAATTPNSKLLWPLHILCDVGCRPKALEIMLDGMEEYDALEAITTKDGFYGQTPLQILNGRKNLSIFVWQVQQLRLARERERTARRYGNWTDRDQLQLDRQMASAHENEFWVKARMLILAKYRYRSRGRKTLRRQENLEEVNKEDSHSLILSMASKDTVKACLSIKECPPSLLEYALLVYRDELRVADKRNDGNLPLHIACTQSQRQPKENHWRVLEVLQAYPEAASKPNMNRKWPLELFLGQGNGKIGWSETLKRLIVANPVALETLKIDFRLYPLILDKVGRRFPRERHSNQDESTSATFELLRGCPSMLSPSHYNPTVDIH